jgi:hypothetical protein
MGSIVRLPAGVQGDFTVYRNGVRQREGTDFTVRGRTLVFDEDLRQEGRLGPWRWFLGAWGIGTYRPHDSIDVRYEVGGQPRVAEGLLPESQG